MTDTYEELAKRVHDLEEIVSYRSGILNPRKTRTVKDLEEYEAFTLEHHPGSFNYVYREPISLCGTIDPLQALTDVLVRFNVSLVRQDDSLFLIPDGKVVS